MRKIKFLTKYSVYILWFLGIFLIFIKDMAPTWLLVLGMVFFMLIAILFYSIEIKKEGHIVLKFMATILVLLTLLMIGKTLWILLT